MRSTKQTERRQLLMESSLAYPRGKEKKQETQGEEKNGRRPDTRCWISECYIFNRRYWILFFTHVESAVQACLNKWLEANEKEKEGRPPTPIEMDICTKLQESRLELRKSKKVLQEIDTSNEAMACVDRIIANIARRSRSSQEYPRNKSEGYEQQQPDTQGNLPAVSKNGKRKEFIGIKGDTDINREKIICLLKEKKLEFVLSETYENRPIKVVIRHLPKEMDLQEITHSLEEKGFKIERITQMKNYREKTLLPLYLVDIKKIGNLTNIYNIKDLCYYRVKVEPYRKRTKAIICLNFSGFYHSARNCHMKPRCIKCNGEHATRESRRKLCRRPASIAERKDIWRPGKAVKPYQCL
ncbi:hypothetical protein AVEN_150408-1 [Araneus ventricosus]|uniref:Pre-C2HC domain-containing protein n=1 Tax=Araneus ventricosus TaxID=182803 RepID=A0A4Y2R097_ARAVE|nr:hypothetical protein AVEN_150408-1 [Araneus ventricosus]